MREGRSGRRRPGLGVLALAAIFIALAIATVAGAVLSGGDDEGSSPTADRTPAQPAERGKSKKQEPKPKKKPKARQTQEAPDASAPAPAAEAPAVEAPATSGASGAELNAQGFELMNQGRYDEAIPILQQAVDSFPSGTTDLNYAYALYNLGRSLRLAGRPDEAVPILERRLKIPNQTDTVQRELDLARQQARES